MPLFRRQAPRDPLIISMTGVALGLRVLILCARDADLPRDVAHKAGLSGQTVALAPSEALAGRVAARAAQRGVLVDTGILATPLPYADQSFDLVIADDRAEPAGARSEPLLLAESFRVLRPGGRIVVLRPAPRRRWLLSAPLEDAATPADLDRQLRAAGFRAARELATREGIRFVEAARAV